MSNSQESASVAIPLYRLSKRILRGSPESETLESEVLLPSEVAYVWNRQSGHRVIIIVDDDHEDVGVEEPWSPPNPYAHGLYATFAQASTFEDTRAIGFFYLPHSMDLVREKLLPDIQGWVAELGDLLNVYFLLDVYFGAEARSDTALGPKVFECFQQSFPGAKFAFLSIAGWGLTGLEEFDEKPKVFPKYMVEMSVSQDKRLPNELVIWLDAEERADRASLLDVAQWRKLRDRAKQSCERLANSEGISDSGLWAHHLPHGGNAWTAATQLFDSVDRLTDIIRSDLQAIASEVRTFPKHSWLHDTKGTIRSWDLPPIRALAQFDSDGKDLTTAFYLVSKDVRELSQGDLRIRFASSLSVSRGRLERDYLWFNVSSIASGLFLLAQCFYHEIHKIQKGESKLIGLPDCWTAGPKRIQCTGGRLFWEITESESKPALGLLIRVSQQLIGWTVAETGFPGDTSKPCLESHGLTLPSELDASGKVKEAYDSLKRGGGKLSIDAGSVEILIPAADVDGVWQVSN